MNKLVHKLIGAGRRATGAATPLSVLAALLLATPAAGAEDASPRPAAADDNVVARRVDEAVVDRPAQRVLDVRSRASGASTRVDVLADGEVGTYTLTELKDPPRLALDLAGVDRAPRAPKSLPGKGLRGVRFGKQDGSVRVVFDAVAAQSLPAYRVERTKTGLAVHFEAPPEAATVAAGEPPQAEPTNAEPRPEPQVAAAPVKAELKAAAPKGPRSRILGVNFDGKSRDAQHVQVALSRPSAYEVTHPEPNVAVLTFPAVELPADLERSLDTSAFQGPVRTVSSFVDPAAGVVRVVAALSQPARDRVTVEGGKLLWTFENEETAQGEVVDEAGNTVRTAGFSAEAPGYALSTVKSKARYKGRRVSFEFKDIDIHNLLRVIAEVSKRNIVVADDVKGRVTIRLRNVPWDQALDLILKTKGLGKEESGNIIRIAPLKQIQAERESAAKAKEANENALPLKVRIIPVNYAMAKDVEAKVKDLLTKRGSVTVDQRTNTLVVKDIVEVLSKAEGMVRALDSQTPQVLISARIVEAASNFTRDLGIQWGGQLSATSATGNSTGLAFPSNVTATGGVPGAFGGGAGVPAQPNWAVSFPAGVAQSSGGAVGLTFGSAGNAAILNLRLTALETQGTLKTVSAPKITTLDNKEATIGQGVSIPFSQVSAAGANTVFVEAKLELKVTPHVTADGSVLLKINARNNQPNPSLTGSNGQPSISKKEADTEVLVADGDTTVIGGIFTRRTSWDVAQVPLFGDIPIIGWLFKSETDRDERSELLIFISPSIVNREASIVAGG